MRTQLLLACVLGTALLAACNNGDKGDDKPQAMAPVSNGSADSFTQAVDQTLASSSDETEPTALDTIQLTQSEQAEPMALQ